MWGGRRELSRGTMDKVQIYLDRVGELMPLWVLYVIPLLALVSLMLIPRRLRLGMSIMVMTIWTPIGFYNELEIAGLAKVTTGLSYLLVAAMAMIHPGPRRPVSKVAWLYPALAVGSLVYILTVRESSFALAIWFNWVLLTVAATLLVRTVTDARSLNYVIKSLAVGLAIALIMPLTSMVVAGGAFSYYQLGRFSPWNANPNHFGPVVVMASAILWYSALRSSHWTAKSLFMTVAGIALVMGVFTGSRSAVYTTVLANLPLLFFVSRKPLVAVISALLIMGVFASMMSYMEATAFERLGSLRSGRYDTWAEYSHIVSQRPWFGLLGTTDQDFRIAENLNYDAHNAYLQQAYLGGMSYAVPLIMLGIYSMFCAYRVWMGRRQLDTDPLLINLLATMMFTVYVHGMTYDAIYYPTHIWCFFHIFLSMLFMTIARELDQPAARPAPTAPIFSQGSLRT